MHLANARLPKGLFLLLAACALIYFSHYYSLLPNVIASHFDRRGFPNGWQTKESFFAVLAGMTVLAGFLVFAIPAIIAFMPRQLINLPHKDYWLGPDQRAASMRFLSAWSAWFGCAVYAVIIWAFDYAVQTNLRSPHGPNPARLWYVLGLFAAFTLVWTMRLFVRFGRPPRLPSA